jgi:hypothetical protein
MIRVCTMLGEGVGSWEKQITFYSEKRDGPDHLERETDERVTLNCFLRKQSERMLTASISF